MMRPPSPRVPTTSFRPRYGAPSYAPGNLGQARGQPLSSFTSGPEEAQRRAANPARSFFMGGLAAGQPGMPQPEQGQRFAFGEPPGHLSGPPSGAWSNPGQVHAGGYGAPARQELGGEYTGTGIWQSTRHQEPPDTRPAMLPTNVASTGVPFEMPREPIDAGFLQQTIDMARQHAAAALAAQGGQPIAGADAAVAGEPPPPPAPGAPGAYGYGSTSSGLAPGQPPVPPPQVGTNAQGETAGQPVTQQTPSPQPGAVAGAGGAIYGPGADPQTIADRAGVPVEAVHELERQGYAVDPDGRIVRPEDPEAENEHGTMRRHAYGNINDPNDPMHRQAITAAGRRKQTTADAEEKTREQAIEAQYRSLLGDQSYLQKVEAAKAAAQQLMQRQASQAMIMASQSRAGGTPEAQAGLQAEIGQRAGAQTAHELAQMDLAAAITDYERKARAIEGLASTMTNFESQRRAFAQAQKLHDQAAELQRQLYEAQRQAQERSFWQQLGQSVVGGIVPIGGALLGNYLFGGGGGVDPNVGRFTRSSLGRIPYGGFSEY